VQLDVGDNGNYNGVSWPGNKVNVITELPTTKFGNCAKSYITLLYKRMSQEGRNGNPATPTILLSILLVCHPQFIPHALRYHQNFSLLSYIPLTSVSNVSKFPCRFRVKFHPNPDCCNRFYPTKNLDRWNWASFNSITRHFNLTMWALIKYLSSDCITTWSIFRLCSFSPSFTSRFQLNDLTNIRWVAIENPWISLEISSHSTAIQRILVGSQIWKRDVKQGVKLHNPRIYHVMI